MGSPLDPIPGARLYAMLSYINIRYYQDLNSMQPIKNDQIESFAVVLAGGFGTRLWPLSRTAKPKQLISLNGNLSLLQQTVSRLLKKVPADHIYTVTFEDQKYEVIGQLHEIDPALVQHVMVEPEARNTLPAISWAVRRIHERASNAVVGVFSSDHSIDDDSVFNATWAQAEVLGEQGYIALIGIEPDRPATGYGYIQRGANLGENQESSYLVQKFVEKPDRKTAESYLKNGGYFWNAGIFIFATNEYLKLLEKHQNDTYSVLNQIDLNSNDVGIETYRRLNKTSIDYGLLEHASQLAVVSAQFKWSDLGSWDEIYNSKEKDAEGNVFHGEVIGVDCQDNLFWAQNGAVAALGVKGLIVVQTDDATLVTTKDRSADLKDLVNQVKAKREDLVNDFNTVVRPWGKFRVIEDSDDYKLKLITVLPGQKLSLQLHNHRSEHWVVIAGTAHVTIDGKEQTLTANQSCYIPKESSHRLENKDDDVLHLIEVQVGSYLGEDDIIRLEDAYGRHLKVGNGC